ncbi:alpha-N-acetylglucosaminidase TIM-barrel domain-containing protein [Pseudactinotalea sp. HY158]|uniref:alpha-N-acetylglucosaminidase TIM-barrel domain-containing protein n=1 Tax=Pseudactinotalea sp. HY158 TaxID=2654547 RepID=UPI00129C8D12|nr:alpha-N-acetylglucosaminidase TIM-barrel domain-containing protein [Pseudactinotalea sp. HY158]QGH69602.1 hypothetical protein GCE65_08795 [Pseudactinotalea sp. HY158]
MTRFPWLRTAATTSIGAVVGGLLLGAGLTATPARAQVGAGAEPAADALREWIGADAAKFDLALVTDPDDADVGAADTYTVSAAGGRVSISATTPATLLAGFNAYVSAVLHQSVSWNGSSLDLPDRLPASEPLTGSANVSHRFVNNDVEDGYTGPYRTLADWQRLVDVYAMHGLNEVFMPVGSDAVYAELLSEYGYSEAEILDWIPQSEHQPWWLLQNMSGGPDPMTRAQLDENAALGRQIAGYIRDLGMVPVLPGYFGTVPAGFAEKVAGARIVPQGGWAGGYDRPDWLDPTSAPFAAVADTFYDASISLLGPTTMYKADLLHEGGRPGDVDVAAASAAVQEAMLEANPASIWVLLGWQNNPPQQVIAGADTSRMFIVDGLSDRYGSSNRDADWHGTPYAVGTIWNFGGHTTMGANLGVLGERYFEALDRAGSALDGIAILPEAGENNPAAFDFAAGLAWRDEPADLGEWFADWAQRRYGVDDPNARAAWAVLGRTAYDMPADGWSEAADSIFGAQPSLTVSTAAAWSPGTQRYDVDEFATALPLLLAAGAGARASETYRYDLMAVARQVLANLDRPLLALIRSAYEDGRAADFEELTAQWLADLDLIDRVAGTDGGQLLGRWLEAARVDAPTPASADAEEAGARAIVSSWTDPAAPSTNLNDYANRLWNGLAGGYYRARWGAYFDHLAAQLAGEDSTAPDFRAMAAEFVAGTAPYEPDDGYRTAPGGDLPALAQEALERYSWVRAYSPTPTPLPAPPGAGITYLSEIGFVSDRHDDAYGPTARDTEIGDAGSHVRRPITVAGTVYERGLGVNSPSTITFNLGAVCTRFDAVAGIDATMDQPGKSPDVTFTVLGDGRELFTSGSVTSGGVEVGVDVTGVRLLTLDVDPNGSEWFDRADWADARVTCSGQIPAPAPPGEGTTYLSHLPFLGADVADVDEFGPVARDTAITDVPTRVTPPITIDGVTYARGLGVQAPTTLSFNLAGRCSVFSADVGVDATMDLPGKSPSVTFVVSGDGEQLWSSGEVTGGPAVSAVVPVDGIETLTLAVDPGAVDWFDRADWADARVTCTDPDYVAPTTSAGLAPEQPASGWYAETPTLTLSSADAVRIEYQLDGGPWQDYTGALTFEEGTTQVAFRGYAGTGAREPAQSLTVRVDSTAPRVEAVVDDRVVTLSASDEGSGVDRIEYSLDAGATWENAGGPVRAPDAGMTLAYRAVDLAGNVTVGAEPVVVEALPDGGDDGSDGPDGGSDGSNGGSDGSNGSDASDGSDGADASDGSDGADGSDASDDTTGSADSGGSAGSDGSDTSAGSTSSGGPGADGSSGTAGSSGSSDSGDSGGANDSDRSPGGDERPEPLPDTGIASGATALVVLAGLLALVAGVAVRSRRGARAAG